jgi:arabinose-5-phosphate isomerase
MSTAAATDLKQLLDAGRRTIEIEARAVDALVGRLDDSFARACELVLGGTGRVVVTGLGKSGHVGGKIAATLASTGTPSFFLHSAEASHGDLGMVARGDVALAISNSGETPEVIALLPHLRRLGVPVIAMTGAPESTLARDSQVHLDVSVDEEACPHNLAPTASTTATLAMGDAFAVALLTARGFTAEDFARSHPGGSLGRRLLLHVSDVMRHGDQLPRIGPTAPLPAGLLEMTRKGMGFTAVVDEQNRAVGIFTDGDLRRVLDREIDLRKATLAEVMTAAPRHIAPTALAAEAALLMETHRITGLLVTDDAGHLAGALNIHDLMRAGVV